MAEENENLHKLFEGAILKARGKKYGLVELSESDAAMLETDAIPDPVSKTLDSKVGNVDEVEVNDPADPKDPANNPTGGTTGGSSSN